MTGRVDNGRLLARGVIRHLRSLGFVALEQFVPAPGLRVDIIALGPKGEVWIIECKSSIADFRSDRKWQDYLQFCEQYFWAVDSDFPSEILPADTGLIIADPYDAHIRRMAPDIPIRPLPPARRKALTLKFARNAADRLQVLIDPRASDRFAPERGLYRKPPAKTSAENDPANDGLVENAANLVARIASP